MKQDRAVSGFEEVFQRPPTVIARAPGRVNLIGEHTDYNEGWVMPAAIEFSTWTAAAPRSDRQMRVTAGNRGESFEFDLDQAAGGPQRHWSDYVRGIAVELERDGLRLTGADLWFAGDIPEGAGLSSSAALETSIGLALLRLAAHDIDRTRLARAGQRAEHHFAGTLCGIMDQFVSAHAREGHALMLDCRNLQPTHVPVPDSLRLVICDSGVKHELASSEYNVRRAQCETGVAWLRTHLPQVQSLRDVTTNDLQGHGSGMDPVVLRRCRHVVSENSRVHAFVKALTNSDLPAISRLMAESHHSLRDDYEVSCNELDALVQFAETAPGCVGSRMTGGGFGGSTINLVHAAEVHSFQEHLSSCYERAVGDGLRIHVSRASAGASLIPHGR